MNQAQMIAKVADASGHRKSVVEKILKATGEVVADAVRVGDEISFSGIGKFSVQQKAARKGRNPSTGAEIDIPAKRVPKFNVAKALKDAANG
jgi:DNA-binding protein HU-beta